MHVCALEAPLEQVGAGIGGLDTVPDNMRHGCLDHLPRMVRRLRQQGYPVSRKRERWLMRLMAPRPHVSRRTPGHVVYTYLPVAVKVTRPKKIWCVDGARHSLRGHDYGLALPESADLVALRPLN